MNVDARSQRSSESGWRDSRPPCVATGSPANLRPQSEKASRRIKVMRRHCRPANPRLIRRRCLLARSLASRIDNETERRKRRRCLASLTGHTILGGLMRDSLAAPNPGMKSEADRDSISHTVKARAESGLFCKHMASDDGTSHGAAGRRAAIPNE